MMSTTRCLLPEVSPLCQSCSRDLDQNQVCFSAIVRRRLSAFMLASVNTSRVFASCTIAGIRPRSSKCKSSISKFINCPSSHHHPPSTQVILYVHYRELTKVKQRSSKH